jgi:hypothetical protein
MKFPIQARPVARQANKARLSMTGVNASGIECQLCHLAWEAIGDPIGKQACHIACDKLAC